MTPNWVALSLKRGLCALYHKKDRYGVTLIPYTPTTLYACSMVHK